MFHKHLGLLFQQSVSHLFEQPCVEALEDSNERFGVDHPVTSRSY